MAGARDVQELVAWQLADEVRAVAHTFAQRPRVVKHFKYCDQLIDAAASATSNIAEGFGRFRSDEFAQCVRVAKGSERQVLGLLVEARQRGFLSDTEFGEFEFLTRRAIAAAAGLIRYLENSRDQ